MQGYDSSVASASPKKSKPDVMNSEHDPSSPFRPFVSRRSDPHPSDPPSNSSCPSVSRRSETHLSDPRRMNPGLDRPLQSESHGNKSPLRESRCSDYHFDTAPGSHFSDHGHKDRIRSGSSCHDGSQFRSSGPRSQRETRHRSKSRRKGHRRRRKRQKRRSTRSRSSSSSSSGSESSRSRSRFCTKRTEQKVLESKIELPSHNSKLPSTVFLSNNDNATVTDITSSHDVTNKKVIIDRTRHFVPLQQVACNDPVEVVVAPLSQLNQQKKSPYLSNQEQTFMILVLGYSWEFLLVMDYIWCNMYILKLATIPLWRIHVHPFKEHKILMVTQKNLLKIFLDLVKEDIIHRNNQGYIHHISFHLHMNMDCVIPNPPLKGVHHCIEFSD